MIQVRKRNGRLVDYDAKKIFECIKKANEDTKGVSRMKKSEIYKIVELVEEHFANTKAPKVESIQDQIEKELMNCNYIDVARSYIAYRSLHAKMRDSHENLYQDINEIVNSSGEDSDTKRSNANIQSDSVMGAMLQVGCSAFNFYHDNYLIPKRFSDAHRQGYMHIHDKDFLSLCYNCLQLDLQKLFKGGFNVGNSSIREPNSVRSASALACIAVQSSQNNMFGGQAISDFDMCMAIYVRKTFQKEFIKALQNILMIYDINYNVEELKDYPTYNNPTNLTKLENEVLTKKILNKAYKIACDRTKEETHQAMESVIFNLNSMHCLPASERIWVYNTETNILDLISMEDLCNSFKNNKYKVISVNNKTGKAEFKNITAVQKKNNNRRLITINTKSGQKVTVTDNHKMMYLNNNGEIKDILPEDEQYKNILSPRFIDTSWHINKDYNLLNYTKGKNIYKNNKCDVINLTINHDFAEILGYYVADGSVTQKDDSVIHFTVCGKVEEKHLTSLMQNVFGAQIKLNTIYFTDSSGVYRPKEYNYSIGVNAVRAIKDIAGHGAKGKKVPSDILLGNTEIIKTFLNAYFACDGKKDKYNSFSTVSKTLRSQINFLIFKLGEVPHYHEQINPSNGYNKTIINNGGTPSNLYEGSLGGVPSKRIGLHTTSDDYKFEIPQYTLSSATLRLKSKKIPWGNIEEGKIPRKKYNEIKINDLKTICEYHNCIEEFETALNTYSIQIKEKTESNSGEEYVYDISVEDNENFLTEDCIYVHNSRAGSQTPFSSLNFGTDTSEEGRLVIEQLLLAQEAGLGHGEISIFPITIFRLKEGINYNLEDKNYDLFKLAMRVSAKRLYPNFENQDATYNMQYYDPNDYRTWISTMGCADGDEVISYKYQGKFYCEGIKHLWERIEDNPKKQGLSKYKLPLDLEIIDDNQFIKVKTVIKNPDRKNWVRVTFTNGRALLVTEDHPLYTENRGRIYVKDLKVSDTIKTYYNVPHFSVNKAIKPTEAYLMGVVLLNGTYANTKHINIYLSNKVTEETVNKIINTANEIVTLKPVEYDLTYCKRRKGRTHKELHLLRLRRFCKKCEKFFGGTKNAERHIPNEIFNSVREVKYMFIQGLLDAKGKIVKNKAKLGTTHKEIALQLVALLQTLEISAKVYTKLATKENIIRYEVEFLIDEHFNYTKTEEDFTMNAPEIIEVKNIEYIGYMNKESFDVETVTDKFTLSFINSGNCRTRTISNVYDTSRQFTASRGNFSFTTLNLPKLAIEANRDIKKFYKLLDRYMKLAKDQLLWRFELIGHRHAYNFPFLMGEHLWLDSEKLKPTDEISTVLKHASLSIGFVGLAETLVSLIGKHHGESAEAQKLGLEIIGHMRKITDSYATETGLNFSLFASPAESYAGRALRLNKQQYGVIKGVTDREYHTNSFHVPVWYNIPAFKKIEIEAPYHELCNAGHISYIELHEDVTKNLKAFEKIIRKMHDSNMGYFAINHPHDLCPNCNNTSIINGHICPICGYSEIYNKEEMSMFLD